MWVIADEQVVLGSRSRLELQSSDDLQSFFWTFPIPIVFHCLVAIHGLWVVNGFLVVFDFSYCSSFVLFYLEYNECCSLVQPLDFEFDSHSLRVLLSSLNDISSSRISIPSRYSLIVDFLLHSYALI